MLAPELGNCSYIGLEFYYLSKLISELEVDNFFSR